MKSIYSLTFISSLFIFSCLPFVSKASEIGIYRCPPIAIGVATDTIPGATKPVEEPVKASTTPKPVTAVKPVLVDKPLPGKPVKAVIKQVPRARKVEVPVKVKIAKPTVFKPAVKIL